LTQRKSVALAAVRAVENVSSYLRVPRLHSIRSRILALAILGTVIPAGVSMGVAYSQNRRAREEKVTQELLSESSQTARAMGVFLKERIYDLRVFATSDEVANNLNRVSTNATVAARLREYLRSLHERFTDFDQLLVLDQQGKVLATSSARAGVVRLPPDWQKSLRQQNQLVGEAYWDTTAKKGKLTLAVPVHRADGLLLGAFAAELTLAPVQALLRSFVPDSNATVYLATTDGALIASSRRISPDMLRTRLERAVLQRLTAHETAAVTFLSPSGYMAVGSIKPVPQVHWAIISEKSAHAAFREVRQFRNVALAVVFALLIAVAASAYYLGIIIVRPLERLAQGAAEVSLGDLDVDLPNTGGGEVAVLTGVFNRMVKRLREGREELERLSVTDGLTGLTNHRALMQRLQEESLRSLRSKREFCVIMTDVDHFKSYNDDFGHPAGDEVLKRVAALLKETTRTVDCVARYGGEEFALLLPETEAAGAVEVAERIRARIAAEPFPERSVTVSIGVAEFPSDGDRPDQIIEVADAALYEAKHSGRNRVVRGVKSSKRPRASSRKVPIPREETLATANRLEKAKKKG
jgi:diguanylate cyclase (GGDEF)-like protein